MHWPASAARINVEADILLVLSYLSNNKIEENIQLSSIDVLSTLLCDHIELTITVYTVLIYTVVKQKVPEWTQVIFLYNIQ